MKQMDVLEASLVDRILSKLGSERKPECSLDGLSLLYDLWCSKVPFDNSRKLIHLRFEKSGPLPGTSAVDFFESWLKHGSGGTCWAGNGAWLALLNSLGFDAIGAVATMLVAPHLPPNHASVIVTIENEIYLVDASILHKKPLKLAPETESANLQSLGYPSWLNHVNFESGRWQVFWQPLHKYNQINCRIEYYPAKEGEFETKHEETRAWSPFNYEHTIRAARGNTFLGLADRQKACILENGQITREDLSKEARKKFLIEEMLLSEELVEQLPEDLPTPPPPGSKTAQLNSERAL